MRKRKSLDPALGGRKRERTARRNPLRGCVRAKNWYLIGTTRSTPVRTRTAETPGFRGFLKGERPDSNRRPPGPQPGALPTELRSPRGTNVAPRFAGSAPPRPASQRPRQDSNL